MAVLARSLGRRRDWPQLESYTAAAGTAGSANDYEHTIFVLPNLATGATSGTSGTLPINDIVLRGVILTPEAAITGAATNFMSLCIRQYRAGVLVPTVNTTSSTTISSGSQVVTPASMANIQLNSLLVFSGGTGSTETVVVTAVTGTTFTATFANGHSGAYTIVCNNIASMTFNAAGVTAAAYTPSALVPGTASNGMTFVPNVLIQPGDVITFQRLSSNVTGLASPVTQAQIEWVPAKINA